MDDHTISRHIKLLVHLHLLTELEIGHGLVDVHLLPIVLQRVELEGQVIYGQVVFPGVVLERSSKETCNDQVSY